MSSLSRSQDLISLSSKRTHQCDKPFSPISLEKYFEVENDVNIRLAAFSSFISEHEKKNTDHNFCQNPLSFLEFSNIKIHRNDYDEFM